MLIIGLTGGIGSGKSSVSTLFRELGVPVIDADEIARQIVQPGKPALDEIVKTFGHEYLAEDGTLDRKGLRDLIFSNPEAKKALEAMLHPKIRETIFIQIGKLDVPYCLLSIPLLLERGWQEMVDQVIVVDCSETGQIERICQRDQLSEREARAILENQIDRRSRLQAADEVIDNSGDLESLAERVENLHLHYLRLAGKR